MLRTAALAVPSLVLAIVMPDIAGADDRALPDTPEVRRQYERSLARYQQVNAEHRRYLDLGDVRMHYLAWGDEDGTPLVWAHGGGLTAFELLTVAPGLVAAGYHVYAITYRGHGETQVTDYDYSLATVADDIAALMDREGRACAVIGGLSIGGAVATTFYENYPDRVMALALEDGGMDVLLHRVERNHERYAGLDGARNPEARLIFADRYDLYRALAGRLQGYVLEQTDEWRAVIQSLMIPADNGWQYHVDAEKITGQWMKLGYSHELPLFGQSWMRLHPMITYRKLSVPMLMIDPTGETPSGFTSDYKRLQALRPEWMQYVEYPQTGHTAHLQRPDWFVRDMARLLERARQAGADACLLQ